MLLPMLLALLGAAAAAPTADRVSSLPGYGPPPTNMYSGFLNASAAERGTNLHYWLALSSSTPPRAADTPVILWLNGGPGSSSVLGMLQEHGPLLIDKDGGLMDNPYAWTTVGHLLVLESPAGVGYSYCAEMERGGSCANTDISTAAAAAAALIDFYAKFPELRANPFFITGESYAGVYCPTLAAQILENNKGGGAPPINLVGMAVGDPCTDNDAQREAFDMLWCARRRRPALRRAPRAGKARTSAHVHGDRAPFAT